MLQPFLFSLITISQKYYTDISILKMYCLQYHSVHTHRLPPAEDDSKVQRISKQSQWSGVLRPHFPTHNLKSEESEGWKLLLPNEAKTSQYRMRHQTAPEESRNTRYLSFPLPKNWQIT